MGFHSYMTGRGQGTTASGIRNWRPQVPQVPARSTLDPVAVRWVTCPVPVQFYLGKRETNKERNTESMLVWLLFRNTVDAEILESVLGGQVTGLLVWLIQESITTWPPGPNKGFDQKTQTTLFKASVLQNVRVSFRHRRQPSFML